MPMGEDVVAESEHQSLDDLKKDLPKAYEELIRIVRTLEINYKDVQILNLPLSKEALPSSDKDRQTNWHRQSIKNCC